jgi:amino acid transporter
MTAILILAIFIFSPKLSSSEFVFTKFNNYTGLDPSSIINNIYVSLIGLLTQMYAFAGYEGAATLAEETNNPHEAAPKGVIYTCIISVAVGLATTISILYGAQGNVSYILHGPSN